MAEPLDPLFDAAAAGPGQPIVYRQGIVHAFDLTTLENTVLVGFSLMQDLPLLGVAEADTLTPGSVVGILCTPVGWFIIGRLVSPNTQAALDAINRLSATTKTASIATSESRSNAAFGDLTTVGPAVEIQVRSSGRLRVTLSASLFATVSAGLGYAYMSFDVAGPDASSASTARSIYIGINSASVTWIDGAPSGQFDLVGLLPGIYTITAKYASGSGTQSGQFANRVLTAQAL
ncbi:MAG: hypothetical protein HOV79_00455 [Hamadaea sp.]|nr:hypothetical protein [Hamadaea sp.]